MIHYAHDCNFQNIAHLIHLIFVAIFEEGKNVSSVETLVQLAKEAGLEGVEDVLSSDQYIKDVLEDDDFAKNNLEIPYYFSLIIHIVVYHILLLTINFSWKEQTLLLLLLMSFISLNK